jgi:CubicO group peptidase (beta-lactamase class C family)
MNAIDGAMQPFVDRGEISGAVMLVADADKILHLSSVGLRDIKRRLPMETGTIFWIASMTKLITAAALMELGDEGKISIDHPVSKYLPEFSKLKTPAGKPANLTLVHLLTHTSGLAEAPKRIKNRARTLGELVPSYLKQPTAFEPGTRWVYCQSGINTLGRIIEIVSGKSFEAFLSERLFLPLGMKEATFFPMPEQIDRLAVSYSLKSGRLKPAKIELLAGAVGDRNHYPAANSGVFCTAGEYGQFARMLLNHGTLDGRQYLRAQTVKEMTRIHTTGLSNVGFVPGSGWGLGFGVVGEPTDITAGFSPGTFGHGGAYGTQAWIDPVKKRIYILMLQRADLDNSDYSPYRRAFQESAIATY